MHRHRRLRRIVLPLAAAAGIVMLSSGAIAPGPRVDASAPAMLRHPLVVQAPPSGSGGIARTAAAAPAGYTPAQMRAYLGLKGDGRGQVIAVTNPFHAPTLADDLDLFSTTFGLPRPCPPHDSERALGRHAEDDAEDCFHFTVAQPQGAPPVDGSWALESALDVQWAHAIAPRADILLVEGIIDELDPMMEAIDYAAAHGASVISNSWYTEEFAGEAAYDRHCRLAHAVCVFASGDSGHPATYPASNPFVIAVGGTMLTLAADGSVISETAWNWSGGGLSAFERRPRYQRDALGGDARGIPDVSYNADSRTGIPVYDSLGFRGIEGWFVVGGTSAGAPQWAGILAVADQLRAERHVPPLASVNLSAQRAIYGPGASALFDVVSGRNGFCGDDCLAAPGYDLVTGLGSPRPGIDVALASAP